MYAQPIPSSRVTNWSNVGAKASFNDTTISILSAGGDNTGVSDNTSALSSALGSLPSGGTVFFPAGTYLFNSRQTIPSGIKIKGEGASQTILNFDCGGSGDAFRVIGSANNTLDTALSGYVKDSSSIVVSNAALYIIGDYIKLVEDDNGRIFSSWANNSIGQILKIDSISTSTNRLFFNHQLRQTYQSSLYPRIQKLNMKKNVGFECFTLNRIDATTGQTNNINFTYVENAYVKGVESFNSNFAHVKIQNSTHVTVSESYFQDGHGYGGGGRAYGTVMQATSGDNLIENNQFKHLRHSILLQSSANGNVIAYNYSTDPYWTGVFLPSNSAGDMVLHGNYPYMNLFEGNICQNIVIDNSHGINGPHNTFFRNRAELYGLFMNSSPASDTQNFVANEITNTSSTLGLYSLQGNGHFEYGNTVKGTVRPTGTDTLTYKSYYKQEIPLFWNGNYKWDNIGVTNVYNVLEIPAKHKFDNGNNSVCNGDTLIRSFNICPSEVFAFAGKQYSIAGNYIDSTINGNGDKVYLDITISILPKPTIQFLGNRLEASVGVSYQWYYNGAIMIVETNPSLSYALNGYYQVEVTDTNGCTQISDSMQVLNAGLADNVKSNIKIYPNPSKGFVNIQQVDYHFNSVSVTDVSGKLVLTHALKGTKNDILSLKHVKKGVYYLVFKNENNQLIKRLIVD